MRVQVHLMRAVLGCLILMTTIVPMTALAQELAKKLEATRQEAIKLAVRDEAELVDAMKRSGGAKRQAIGKQLKFKRDVIKFLKTKKEHFVPRLPVDMSVNSFGKLPERYEPPHVVEIIDEDEFIGEFKLEKASRGEKIRGLIYDFNGTPEHGTVGELQLLHDTSNAIKRSKGPVGFVYVKGIPTGSANTGSYSNELPFRRKMWDYYFEINGTKEFLGQKIPVLQVVD